MLTQANIPSWYEGLNKSGLTPPGPVFSIVWSILYALLAIVGWVLWCSRNESEMRSVFYLYSVQMLMNWAWTPLFLCCIGLVLVFMDSCNGGAHWASDV